MRTLILFLFIISGISFAQQKYLIYFTEKINTGLIAKESESYNSALKLLSERSIQRRKKTMGENFIRTEDIPLNNEYVSHLESNGITIINKLKWLNAVSAYLTEQQVRLVQSLSFVKKTEPVRTFSYKRTGVQTLLLKQNAADTGLYGNSFTQLNLSGIPQVHKKGITGRGVLLGVLDSGFRWRIHESLANAGVIAEHDFIFDDDNTENEPEDVANQHNHGTTVLSVIGGYKDSVLIGAAYDAQFILAKTEDLRSETRIEEDNYAAALEWMENFGVDITTSSLGYSEFDGFSYSYEDMNGKTTIVTKAAELAFERGVLTITSAGNEGLQNWFYITAPADGINTIAVGAVDNKNRVADFSSRGPSYDGRIKPDVTAMGVSVFGASAVQSNLYGNSSGTSLSAPIASGSAVLLLSAFPHLSNIQMRDIILKTADNYSSPDNERGYGLVSAAKAIEYPNLEFSNNRFLLKKIFLEDDIVQLNLFLSSDSKTYNQFFGIKPGLNFLFLLPEYLKGQVLKFYFEYPDLSGNTIRVPYSGCYSFTYGEMLIKQVKENNVNYILNNNYPNPFNSTTKINFYADKPGNASLEIFDLLGRKVKTLFNAEISGGEYIIEWNGRDDEGNYTSSGVYICRFNLNDYSVSQKIMLLK